jgi:uncharacterized protein YndB with AHSA1/START domain
VTPVEREVVVPAAPDEVWPAVTRGEEMSAWFGADVEIDARPAGRGTVRWADGTERHVLVEAVEPERRLAFRWLPFQRTPEGDMQVVPASRVEITLSPAPGGTRVRVVEQPAFGGGAPRVRMARTVQAMVGT